VRGRARDQPDLDVLLDEVVPAMDALGIALYDDAGLPLDEMRPGEQDLLTAGRLDEDWQAGVDATGKDGRDEGIEVHGNALHVVDAVLLGDDAGDVDLGPDQIAVRVHVVVGPLAI